jgi:hypothetical protein
MLLLAASLLGVTGLIGVGLFALAQWAKPAGAVWPPAALHGLLGLLGYAALLSAARPEHGSFGIASLILLGATLAAGLTLFGLRFRPAASQALILGLHVTLAAAGLLMLGAWLSG